MNFLDVIKRVRLTLRICERPILKDSLSHSRYCAFAVWQLASKKFTTVTSKRAAALLGR